MRCHAAYCSYEIALAPLVSAGAIPALIALLAAATPEGCSYMVHLNAAWALYRYCACVRYLMILWLGVGLRWWFLCDVIRRGVM